MTREANQVNQIIARCWTDESFKNRLKAEPAATLKAEGLEVPPGLVVKVLENDRSVFHLVIPERRATGGELSEDDLQRVAGGGTLMDFGVYVMTLGQGADLAYKMRKASGEA